MILHVRDVDDLRQARGHEPHHVGARVLFAEERRLEVGRGIVAAVVDVPVGAFGRDDLQAGRQVRRVVHLVELILKPLVHVDLRQRHADRHELADGLGHDLVRGHAERIAAAVDLDADDVRRLEETPPRVRRRAGARQRAHPPRHHLAHDLVVGLVGRDVDALVGFDRHDAAGVRARHAGRRRWSIAGHHAQGRQVRPGRSGRARAGSGRGRSRSFAAVQRPRGRQPSRKRPPPAAGRMFCGASRTSP